MCTNQNNGDTAASVMTNLEAILRAKLKLLPQDHQECFSAEQNVFSLGFGINSRMMVYLVVLLEEHYGIQFTGEDFEREDFYSLRGLADIIMQKIAQRRA